VCDADVVIVGGGPAGAGTAFQLARAGVRVRIIERARFPRPKPCAECVSPQASRILHDMGILAALEPRGALLRGMAVRAPNGAFAYGDYVAGHGFRAFRDRGLSIRRAILDEALLSSARAVGADVHERARVTHVLRDDAGRATGVAILDAQGRTTTLRADVVIGADGLRSVVARRLGLARTRRWPDRIAVIGHYRDARDVGEYGEMHIERDGFVGIADVGNGVTTVAAVFPRERAREISAARQVFLERWLKSKSHLAPRFAGATRVDEVAVVGPFASHARRAAAAGALLVGDAADFFDPFTGEGIYAALRGGELAAAAIVASLGAATHGAAQAALESYDGARRREFAGKWRVERLIGAGVASVTVANRAVRALSSDKRLADLLIGVTGDFVPPAEVLNLSYLARLFGLPSSHQHRTAA
jgi:menaquinone-9 beta-reductase